jgi:hypothetical protein
MSVSAQSPKPSGNIAAKLEEHHKAMHNNRKTHPDLAMVAARKALESIVNALMRVHIGKVPGRLSLSKKMYELEQGKYVSKHIYTQMSSLREQTNPAAHDDPEPMLKRDVDTALVTLSGITEWFCMTYTTQFDDNLIELLDRFVMLEREHVEAPLLREIEEAKLKLRETEAYAEQALFNGMALGAVGVIGALGAFAGIKKLLNKAKSVKTAPRASGLKQARKAGQTQPKAFRPERTSQPLTPEQKARLAQVQALTPEQKARLIQILRDKQKKSGSS